MNNNKEKRNETEKSDSLPALTTKLTKDEQKSNNKLKLRKKNTIKKEGEPSAQQITNTRYLHGRHCIPENIHVLKKQTRKRVETKDVEILRDFKSD